MAAKVLSLCITVFVDAWLDSVTVFTEAEAVAVRASLEAVMVSCFAGSMTV